MVRGPPFRSGSQPVRPGPGLGPGVSCLPWSRSSRSGGRAARGRAEGPARPGRTPGGTSLNRSEPGVMSSAGTVIMPPGSRRATITPASAVRVSRSTPRQPSATMVTGQRPAGSVDAAESVHHIRPVRRAGQWHRPAGTGLALPEAARPGGRDNRGNGPGCHGRLPDRRRPRGRGQGRPCWLAARRACSSNVWFRGNSRFGCPRPESNQLHIGSPSARGSR